MKELKVREKITLKVVESPSCTGCYFENRDTCPNWCSPCERFDNKHVIFKEVKE